MVCYKCDMCEEIHDSLGEMHNVKISYAGKANVVYQNNGEYILCNKCKNILEKMLLNGVTPNDSTIFR